MHIRERKWRKKDGSISKGYEVVYKDSNGNLKRKLFKKKPSINDINSLGNTVRQNPYFKEAIDNYVNIHCKVNCKESTIETYQNYVKVALKPLHTKKVKQFNFQYCEEFIVGLRKKYEPKTVNNILTFLKGFFNYLLTLKIITENPAKNIKKIPLEQKKVKALTEEEELIFVECLKRRKFWVYIFFMVLLRQGIRISECIALEWDDINFDKGLMSINKQFYRNRLTATKNYATREITIPEDLLGDLRKFYEQRTSNLMFNSSRTNGKHVCVSNMRDRHFYPIIKDVEDILDKDLSDYTPHSLRHTHATYLLQNCVPVIAVSRRLGHKDCNVTFNTYNHYMPSDEEKIIHLLNKRDMSQNMSQKFRLEAKTQ